MIHESIVHNYFLDLESQFSCWTRWAFIYNAVWKLLMTFMRSFSSGITLSMHILAEFQMSSSDQDMVSLCNSQQIMLIMCMHMWWWCYIIVISISTNWSCYCILKYLEYVCWFWSLSSRHWSLLDQCVHGDSASGFVSCLPDEVVSAAFLVVCLFIRAAWHRHSYVLWLLCQANH